MTPAGKRKVGMTAAELMAQLAQDKEFQKAAATREAEYQQRVSEYRAVEQPIVADLRGIGVEVDSVWDLVNTAKPYPEALPVLMKHLERGGYPERVMESLGRALAVKPSVVWWERLKGHYLDARDPGEEDGAAVALAACATKDQLTDLIGFLSVEERGESRIYFLAPIMRLGGEYGLQLVQSLTDDKTFGKEATALLRRSRER